MVGYEFFTELVVGGELGGWGVGGEVGCFFGRRRWGLGHDSCIVLPGIGLRGFMGGCIRCDWGL